MKVLLRKIESFAGPRYAPWLFLIVAFLAYGLLFWRHGFYWDDLPMTWIRYELGREAMAKYFSTARPVWAVLYQVTTTFLPPAPMAWQIFSILWRWLGVVLLWQLVRELWRDRDKMAALAGLLFLLYPGFNLQYASFLTTHFWIVVCFFFASFLLTLRAMNSPSRYWLFTSLAMILSALNLWMLEYFYSLEHFLRVAAKRAGRKNISNGAARIFALASLSACLRCEYLVSHVRVYECGVSKCVFLRLASRPASGSSRLDKKYRGGSLARLGAGVWNDFYVSKCRARWSAYDADVSYGGDRRRRVGARLFQERKYPNPKTIGILGDRHWLDRHASRRRSLLAGVSRFEPVVSRESFYHVVHVRRVFIDRGSG